jgi:hypothetical protein
VGGEEVMAGVESRDLLVIKRVIREGALAPSLYKNPLPLVKGKGVRGIGSSYYKEKIKWWHKKEARFTCLFLITSNINSEAGQALDH